MPQSIVVTLKVAACLFVFVLVVSGILAVLDVFEQDQLMEFLETALLIVGIGTIGSVALSAVVGGSTKKED